MSRVIYNAGGFAGAACGLYVYDRGRRETPKRFSALLTLVVVQSGAIPTPRHNIACSEC